MMILSRGQKLTFKLKQSKMADTNVKEEKKYLVEDKQYFEWLTEEQYLKYVDEKYGASSLTGKLIFNLGEGVNQ